MKAKIFIKWFIIYLIYEEMLIMAGNQIFERLTGGYVWFVAIFSGLFILTDVEKKIRVKEKEKG